MSVQRSKNKKWFVFPKTIFFHDGSGLLEINFKKMGPQDKFLHVAVQGFCIYPVLLWSFNLHKEYHNQLTEHLSDARIYRYGRIVISAASFRWVMYYDLAQFSNSCWGEKDNAGSTSACKILHQHRMAKTWRATKLYIPYFNVIYPI